MASRWRPKNRRQILQLDDEGSHSPLIQNNPPPSNPPLATTAAPANKLHALLGHYNSDDEDSSKEEEDSEFKDFMNEIKSAEEVPVPTIPSVWQELWDPQSGQPYFWHTVTNELTWEKPHDLLKPPSSKPSIPSTKVNTNLSIKEDSKDTPPGTSGIKQEPPIKTVVVSTPIVEKPNLPDPLKTDVIKKDEGKVSFKIGASERNLKTGQEFTQAKTNGRLTIDVDSIIAAIEMEVPPDHKSETFVPLFRRRPQQPSDSRPKLGNDFKKFFPLVHQPVLDLEVRPDSPLKIVNTFKGLGFQEKEDIPVSTPVQKVQFIAGEILKPLVVVPPVAPMTVAQKITRLENHLSSQELPAIGISKSGQLSAQLEILKEAWNQKKLETDFLEEWLDKIENNLKEETAKPETQQDQVIDMVLEDSDGERPATPPAECPSSVVAKEDETECLDSVLNSFYTDLASLDSVAPNSPIVPVTQEPTVASLPDAATTSTPEIVVASVGESGTSVVEEETSNEPVKGIKRTKMSSDMTSLVAKWQKIHQTNT